MNLLKFINCKKNNSEISHCKTWLVTSGYTFIAFSLIYIFDESRFQTFPHEPQKCHQIGTFHSFYNFSNWLWCLPRMWGWGLWWTRRVLHNRTLFSCKNAINVFKICYLPNYTSIRDVGATETCATILPMYKHIDGRSSVIIILYIL